MHLSVPANYDSALIPRLREYPVREVYGRLPRDPVGGGRAAYCASLLGPRRLAEYVAAVNRHGMTFDYVLNASCLGNREWSRGWQRRLAKFAGWLVEIGVRTVTVSTPYLLERIKRLQPGLQVRVGIYAQVDTPRRARFWEELGADSIVLESFSINRDFARLAAIRKAVRCDLHLVVNHICLPNCPIQPYHQSGCSHSSAEPGRLFVDYCFLRCSRRRLLDPASFVRSQWIRPEDLHVYEAMGFQHFKLLERDIPSGELIKRVRAYAERRWDGNLAELLLPYGFRTPIPRARFWALRHFFKPGQVSPVALQPLLDLARHEGMLYPLERLPVVVEALRIPVDFIEGFRNRDCASLRCEDCRYCDRIASEAVRVDRAHRDAAIKLYGQADEALLDGKLWR
jgi:collagenase-like PrtC family protease